jgi:chromosome segregation ATPase
MKYLLGLMILSLGLISCGGGNADVENMQRELDSLKSINSDAAASIDQYIGDLNDIYSSLEEIKRKEGAISKNALTQGEIAADKKTLIQEDILLIQQLMQENKDKIASLRKRVKKGDAKMKELEKLIANLQKDIEAKDKEIESLKLQLESLNIEFENLASSYDQLAVENAEKNEIIENQTNEINTVYYAMGTFKELVNNKVLDKGGAFAVKSGAKVSSDINVNYFTISDLRKLSEIKIGAKKASLKTSHPSDSYKLVSNGGKVEKLVITDAQKFWKTSKYCVIILD